MTNYNDDILKLLKGETPKQKYEYLLDMKNALSSVKGYLQASEENREMLKIQYLENVKVFTQIQLNNIKKLGL